MDRYRSLFRALLKVFGTYGWPVTSATHRSIIFRSSGGMKRSSSTYHSDPNPEPALIISHENVNAAQPLSAAVYRQHRLSSRFVPTMPTDGNPSPNFPPIQRLTVHVAAGNAYRNRSPNTWFPKKFAGLRYYDTPLFRPLWPFVAGGTCPIPFPTPIHLFHHQLN